MVRFLDVAHVFRRNLRVQEASELEVLVFADLHLEAMGYLFTIDHRAACPC